MKETWKSRLACAGECSRRAETEHTAAWSLDHSLTLSNVPPTSPFFTLVPQFDLHERIMPIFIQIFKSSKPPSCRNKEMQTGREKWVILQGKVEAAANSGF